MKKTYLKIGVSTLLIGAILISFYRPYIYSNKINDYGFADVIGSLISVISFCFILWSINDYPSKVKNKQILLATFIYSFFWEFLGFINIYGTFDIKDVFAGLVSGLITYLLKIITDAKFNDLQK